MHPVHGSSRCYAHDPTKAAARAAARKRGGKNRRRSGADPPDSVSLASADDIRVLLERVALDSFLLDNSAKRGRVLIAAATVALKGLEVGALEERIEALENYVRSMGTT